MNLLLTIVFTFFVFIIGILPFRVLYIFSDLMYYILLYVIRYRKTVVRQNLENCFPQKDQKEIDRLVRLSYKNLTDVIVEGIKAFTMSEHQIRERHKVLNPEILDDLVNAKKGVIATPCHYGNWEWGSMSASLYFKHKIIVFYKPLSNPHINRIVNKNRSRTGGILTSIYKTSDTFKELTDQKAIYIMAADQSPSNAKRAIWVDFMGRKTAFLHGPELYGKTYNYPVVFTDITRVKRGFYELTLSIISDHSSETAPGDITRIYAQKLETVIKNKPEDYLWSHKRWKHQK